MLKGDSFRCPVLLTAADKVWLSFLMARVLNIEQKPPNSKR
jgi:hypothetical protein